MWPGVLDIGRQRHCAAPRQCCLIDVDIEHAEFRSDGGIVNRLCHRQIYRSGRRKERAAEVRNLGRGRGKVPSQLRDVTVIGRNLL
jgi:hypothetical protein